MESISNQYVSEGTATPSTELTLPWRARQIEILNDSGSKELGYKFNSGETYATLKPLESVTPAIKSKTIFLNGTGAYRVRAYG